MESNEANSDAGATNSEPVKLLADASYTPLNNSLVGSVASPGRGELPGPTKDTKAQPCQALESGPAQVINYEPKIGFVLMPLTSGSPSVPEAKISLTVGSTFHEENIIQDQPAAEQEGFYAIPPNCRTVTEEFDPKDLFNKFKGLIWGPPIPRDPDERDLESKKRLKEFIGDITDEQFIKLAGYCSEEKLRMPYDLKLNAEGSNVKPYKFFRHGDVFETPSFVNLATIRQIKKRIERDPRYTYSKVLKYRGDRTSLQRNVERDMPGPVDLKPGEELLIRVRIYRPFVVVQNTASSRKFNPGPKLQQDYTFLGSQTLEELLNRIKCVNDFGPRTDCSDNPDVDINDCPMELYPSGFLFINNVFYVDTRHPRCIDYSEPIRAWARKLKIGDFQCLPLTGVRFDSLKMHLGYPEVYMHQGNCEHLFTFSEVSLLQPSDYCSTSVYPYRTALHVSNTNNCIICTNFVAKWIVVGSDRVPFDPAYICETCFRLYMYYDGKKVGGFKAYRTFERNTQI